MVVLSFDQPKAGMAAGFMLGTRCAAASGVLVRNRLRTGTTIVLLPLFLAPRIKDNGSPRKHPEKVLESERLQQALHEPQQPQHGGFSSHPVSRTAG